jgi:hypothetical protein
MTHKSRKRVIVDGGFGTLKLFGESASADVADGADFQRNAALGEKIHEIAVVERRDAMTDALCTEKFNRFADLVGAADFPRMNETVKTDACCTIVNGPEVCGGDAQFIAADAECDD